MYPVKNEGIETCKSLDTQTINLITSLHLLDKDEQVIFFYSNYKKTKAGSFITDKRIAHYWLDAQPVKSDTSFALYKDIISIDTFYHLPDFNCPYMEITARDNRKFRSYADGSIQNKRMFFEKAVALWKKKRN